MDITGFENELWYILKLIKKSADTLFNPFLEECGVTKLQANILMGIKSGEFNTVGRMADEMSINQGNASTIAKKLEQLGLVNRTRSRDDERVVILALTKEGERRIEKFQTSLRNMCLKMSEHFTSERLEKILTGFVELQYLIDVIKNSVNSEQLK